MLIKLALTSRQCEIIENALRDAYNLEYGDEDEYNKEIIDIRSQMKRMREVAEAKKKFNE